MRRDGIFELEASSSHKGGSDNGFVEIIALSVAAGLILVGDSADSAEECDLYVVAMSVAEFQGSKIENRGKLNPATLPNVPAWVEFVMPDLMNLAS